LGPEVSGCVVNAGTAVAADCGGGVDVGEGALVIDATVVGVLVVVDDGVGEVAAGEGVSTGKSAPSDRIVSAVTSREGSQNTNEAHSQPTPSSHSIAIQSPSAFLPTGSTGSS